MPVSGDLLTPQDPERTTIRPTAIMLVETRRHTVLLRMPPKIIVLTFLQDTDSASDLILS